MAILKCKWDVQPKRIGGPLCADAFPPENLKVTRRNPCRYRVFLEVSILLWILGEETLGISERPTVLHLIDN